MKKNALIGIAILFTIILAVSYFATGSLNRMVKGAIEVYGSEASGTQVSVGKVEITLATGEGIVDDLQVRNAAGFTDRDIFRLGRIVIKLDTDTLMDNPVVLDELTVRAPTVHYEIDDSGSSNLDVLRKNLSAGGSGKNADNDEFRMIIRKLIMEDGRASVRIAALGEREQSVRLPSVQLTDVGKKSGGATAAEVASLLSRELVKNTNASVATLGVEQYLGKSADLLGNSALDSAGSAAIK